MCECHCPQHPGSELRGHVLGHWLSALALSIATWRGQQADASTTHELEARLEEVLTTLQRCQQTNGWLAAFEESFLDRVERMQPVWAPCVCLARRAPTSA